MSSGLHRQHLHCVSWSTPSALTLRQLVYSVGTYTVSAGLHHQHLHCVSWSTPSALTLCQLVYCGRRLVGVHVDLNEGNFKSERCEVVGLGGACGAEQHRLTALCGHVSQLVRIRRIIN